MAKINLLKTQPDNYSSKNFHHMLQVLCHSTYPIPNDPQYYVLSVNCTVSIFLLIFVSLNYC